MTKKLRTYVKNQQGVVNIEFILILPVLLILLIGGYSISIAIADKLAMQSVATDTAKLASELGGDTATVREYAFSTINNRLIFTNITDVRLKIGIVDSDGSLTTQTYHIEKSGEDGKIYDSTGGVMEDPRYAANRSVISVILYADDQVIPFMSTAGDSMNTTLGGRSEELYVAY